MFGANTENAVRAFQRKYNLSVERIAGANTIKKLESVLKQKSSPGTPSNMNGSAVVPYPGYVIRRNSTDRENVQRIQRALDIIADGVFGPNTESAVRAYQRRKGLKADGIVGPVTWNTFF